MAPIGGSGKITSETKGSSGNFQLMITGILYGLAAAFLQSCSYVFSRNFVVRHADPIHLMIYSQVVMGGFAALLLPLTAPPGLFGHADYVLPVVLCAAGYLAGQGSFFMTLRELEASRASSLLGVKLVVLALINLAVFGVAISALQWLAVILCMVAAVMMNFSGGQMSGKAVLWLFATCVGYSFSDIYGKEAVFHISGDASLASAMTSTALCYLLLGLIAFPAIFFIRRSRSAFLAAIPFGICWFGAMLVLFGSFALLGVVFGNIIQSLRGLMSIGLGVLLAHGGFTHLEARTGGGVFRRRLASAILMITAIAIYSYSKLR